MWCSLSRGAAQEARTMAEAAMKICRAILLKLSFPGLPTIKSEELLCSCGRSASNFFQRHSSGPRNFFRDQSGVGRLAPFSAIRHRREIRAISFNHETVERNFRSYVADLFSILECHDSGKRNEMAQRQNLMSLLDRKSTRLNSSHVSESRIPSPS